MKKTITLLGGCLLLSLQFSFAQLYPAFNVTAYDSSQSSGYYFFCPYILSQYPLFPQGTQHQMILDKKGKVVYTRDITGTFSGDFKLLSNGLMSYCSSGKFYVMDSTFTIVDSVTTGNGVDFDIHDLQVTPNGHYLILGNEDRQMNLSSYHIFLNNGTAGSTNATVRGFVVQEFDSAKNIVFEWRSLDHFAFDDVDEYWLTNVANVDWTHVNALELDYDGNFLVSSRHFDEITKINRSDSSIVWRFGGKRNNFTFIGDSIQFLSQHDCRRLSNGNLTLFDNGRNTSPLHYASSKEYTLDELNLTATLVWSHNEGIDHWSRSQGNTQRLANGNTLNSYGNLVPTPIVFNVVDSLDNKVFEIVFHDSLISYRSFNFPSFPWQLNRPKITCTHIGAQFFMTADSGFSQYIWSTGDTTQSIPINALGDFSVFVPRGDNGFISSEDFTVTDTVDPCGFILLTSELSADRFTIYPNPSSGYLTLSSGQNSSTDYRIYDITGREIKSGKIVSSTKTQIDINALSEGVYIIRAGRYQQKFIKQ